ncbi:hypothetical protein SCHPADRAFT_263732 [Schizopora paradoxa]|uniref:Uncharacterized protein n=1 Tax=Schizopora paradoxa TaxID=27342 RepID=A0A0H2RU25_9AGAM|nr:hypothetical protein SCHPADRAFT_263732 [Schizopora paradoxa]
MASVDLRDESQLLWIEINVDKDDKLRLSIRDSEGKETAIEKKKGDGDAGKNAQCIAFSEDTIIVTPPRGFLTKLIGRLKTFFKKSQDHSPPQKKEISASSVIRFLVSERGKDGQTFEYPLKDTSVTLHVTLKSLGRLSGSSIDDSKLGEEYDKLNDSLLADGTLNALRDLANNLKGNVNLEVLDAIMNRVKSIAEVHPLINTAVTALSIPYKMWRQEHEFKENLKALARDMCTSLESMIEAYPSIESEHAKKTATELVRLILRASAYVKSFSMEDERSIPQEAR